MMVTWWAMMTTLAMAANPSDAPTRPPRPIFGSANFTAKKLPQRTPDDADQRPARPPAARSVPARTVADSAPPPGQPIHSRERAFRVPFRVDASERPRLAEVQLFFSVDRGNTWKQYTAAKPDDESFTFAARGDGEYWFAVRTLDRERRLYPPTLTGVAPGLRVIVDTLPPEVNLRTIDPPQADRDQIGIEWDIADDYLDLNSLRAEFRSDDSPSWFPINLEPRARGQATWRPGIRGRIIVRLRVLDRAGNEGVKEVVVGSASTGVPAFGSATANRESGPPSPATALGNANAASRSNGFQVPARPNLSATDWTNTNPPPPAAALDPKPPGGSSIGNASPTPNRVGDTASGQGRVVPWERNDRSSGAQESRSRPPGPTNVQLVNSTRFGINYDILDKGKSGISSVKLYYTYDGRSWEEYGEDDDKMSPFPVRVNGEGTYGFTIVVKSGAGMGDEAPSPGDPPQVWIEVDTTPPVVVVGPPELGKGAAAGILGITWTVQDRNLAPRSINLSYAESSNGPWKSIAKGIDNTGRYQWSVPPEAPYRFYVRVEAKDRAENVGRAETDSPVIVDIARPKAKIVGVDAAGSPFKADADK